MAIGRSGDRAKSEDSIRLITFQTFTKNKVNKVLGGGFHVAC